MKQASTIIDVRPAYQGVKSIIAKVEMRRRGIRFLPRQALKHVLSRVSNAVTNPFDLN